jgi:beta-mannosidase
MSTTGRRERARVECHTRTPISEGWELASTSPRADGDVAELDRLPWMPAAVPGTVSGARRAAGMPTDSAEGLDHGDWWFRTRFDGDPAGEDEEVVLAIGGIATVADVHLNGEHLLSSESMFASHRIEVGGMLRGSNELAVRCRALAPIMSRRRRPRARWRTRLADNKLRFFRTMLLGRAPGFAPGPPVVGPWRPIFLERRSRVAVEGLRLRPRIEAGAGRLEVAVDLRSIGPGTVTAARLEVSGPSGSHGADLDLNGGGDRARAEGSVDVPDVACWMPHTHGDPHLHSVRLVLTDDAGPIAVDAGRVGFRTLAPGPASDHDVEKHGFDFHVNDVRVFARGAVWTPIDPVGMNPAPEQVRGALERARDAGMNMIRVVGTSAYEPAEFHDLCDELGILVWQDFMFANMDYPIADDDFRATVESEAREVLAAVADRPSLAVLCGNSEVEQQVAMLGLDPALGRGELFGEILPGLVREADADAAYVPSAPFGGELPFSLDRGVANYFGVGGYRRNLDDVRRSNVRFASECLAIANVPGEATLETMASGEPLSPVHDPRWKAGVPRDAGSGWDFDDVRDHYLEMLFEVDPVELRSIDPGRYLELSRAVSGELMAEVFGEWRRPSSPSGGGLVLWLRDLVAGAGWGLLDATGSPKVAVRHLQRRLAPIAVWTTDEGLDGIAVHLANDRPEPFDGDLRIGLYRDCEQLVEESTTAIRLAAHDVRSTSVEALFGRFVDSAWAFRFGPPPHDVIAISLERDGEPASQDFCFPAGRPIEPESPSRIGLEAAVTESSAEGIELNLKTRRLAYGVRIHAPGLSAADDAFSIAPGGERRIRLLRTTPEAKPDGLALTALNMSGRVTAAGPAGR